MKKRVYYLILLELVIVVILTTAWEFWFEDFTYELISVNHVSEDLTERLEYIITSSLFVMVALIIPIRIIIRDFSKLERITAELKNALDSIKKLQGLLPICANCKKIRDDDGYWQQLEVYIRNHSEAEFSHGICPPCAKKLYPDL